MKKYLGFVAVLVFLLSCANTDRDNPYDERAINYIGNAFVEGSSSSVGTGEEPSSSSEESPSSSGSVVRSSSSVGPSSSSGAGLPSSSSVAPSSSSVTPSSSSVAPSSSSSSSIQCSNAGSGTFTDSRDTKTYIYVTICSQTWMAENLNYAASGSKCYGNSDSYCNTYGRLYDWSTAMDLPSSCNSSSCSSQIQINHRGVCPAGWHIPSDAEWDALVTFAGGYFSSTAGTKLKAASGWNSSNGTNDYGFSALPGGYGYQNGSFGYVGSWGNWWSATEHADYTSSHASNRGMNSSSDVGIYGTQKPILYSVRCVQD